MAIRALESGNVYIQYDDAVYELEDHFGDTAKGHFIIKRISNQQLICTVYGEAIIRWHTDVSAFVTAVGLHLRIALP